MFRKSIIAGMTLALLLGGGGYFSNMNTDTAIGAAYAATSNTPINSGRIHPHQGSMQSSARNFGSVNVMSVSESTMNSKMTNTSRYAVYVGNGGSYTEYWSTASDVNDAARAILQRVNRGTFRTSNYRLYQSMLNYGHFSSDGTYSNHGNTVYRFRG